MQIDTTRIRELLNRRDEIDRELAAVFSGAAPKKPITCSVCKQEGHTARSCPSRAQEM